MKILNSILVLILSITLFTNCKSTADFQSKKELLTAHKWQLVSESGLNLPTESLGDNIIELTKEGGWVYFDGKKTQEVFTQNKWELSADEKKIIEILPNDKRIESEILELTDNTLKFRYEEKDNLKGTNIVVETYTKFVQ